MYRKDDFIMPKKLWHQSRPENRDSIEKDGLLPRVGIHTKEIYNSIGADLPGPFVYLQDINIDIFAIHSDLDMWEIDMSKLDENLLGTDPLLEEFCYIYSGVIPKDALKLIHRGTGKDRYKEYHELVSAGGEYANDYVESKKELLRNEANGKLDENILPKYLYHKAPPSVRDNIKKEGLKPMVGDSYWLKYEDEFGIKKENLKPLVFLFDRAISDYDSTYDDDIYRIKTENLDTKALKKDAAIMKYCYTYPYAIPPENIDLVYMGTGDSDW